MSLVDRAATWLELSWLICAELSDAACVEVIAPICVFDSEPKAVVLMDWICVLVRAPTCVPLYPVICTAPNCVVESWETLPVEIAAV